MNLWRRSFSWRVLSAAVTLGVTSGLILAISNLALGGADEGFFPKAKLSRPIHQVRVVTNIMIPMRDGTQLAADIYMPSGKGPFPVLVERTPYGKSGNDTSTGPKPLMIQPVSHFFVVPHGCDSYS